MSFVFCRGCAHRIHDTALTCPQCGASQAVIATANNDGHTIALAQPSADVESSTSTPHNAFPQPAVSKKKKKPVLLYIVTWLGVGLFGTLSAIVLSKGAISNGLVILACAIGFFFVAPIAWKLGDMFREFTQPTALFASGAVDMAKKKMFWLIGPQLIAVGIAFCGFVYLAASIIDSPKEPTANSALNDVPVISNIQQEAVNTSPLKTLSENDTPKLNDVSPSPEAYVPPKNIIDPELLGRWKSISMRLQRADGSIKNLTGECVIEVTETRMISDCGSTNGTSFHEESTYRIPSLGSYESQIIEHSSPSNIGLKEKANYRITLNRLFIASEYLEPNASAGSNNIKAEAEFTRE